MVLCRYDFFAATSTVSFPDHLVLQKTSGSWATLTAKSGLDRLPCPLSVRKGCGTLVMRVDDLLRFFEDEAMC